MSLFTFYLMSRFSLVELGEFVEVCRPGNAAGPAIANFLQSKPGVGNFGFFLFTSSNKLVNTYVIVVFSIGYQLMMNLL
ncbi:hypothetical protein LA5095_03675 [Roseibium album]|uniref:Uncharacterized protein n=1 Tax=Roseibium album TaxID=311410 RepID=A0A0M7APC1_9HYPH|nr:hypothetical protein LA5094_02616 [Roseibium album]CTQ76497.1 hypothetical protein LA5095_03675 [Roseibium album]CTQ76975.1 hypothetical protein LA5096_04957 [Roseibium album]